MRLTSIITAAILAASSAGAVAAEGGDRMARCEATATIANDAINARQTHVMQHNYRDRVREEYDVDPKKVPLIDGIITAAYNVPVYSVPQDRRHAIERFVQNWRQACEEHVQ